MAKVQPDGPIQGLQFIDMFAFLWQSDHFWLRYNKFHIWPWKLKVKGMMEIDQNLISYSVGEVHQSCQKWKK